MSKTDEFENALLALIFNGTAIPNMADNAATDPAVTITVSLHTADPTDTGNMSTNEAAYPGYARHTVNRSGAGWTVTGNAVSPVANIDFPTATGGAETITHAGFGSGVGNNLMYKGPVTPNISVQDNVTPRLTTASVITED